MTYQPHRAWSAQEDRYLDCPIPNEYLAFGALRGRTPAAIHVRRKNRKKAFHQHRKAAFADLPAMEHTGGNGKYSPEDFPGVDWSATIRELTAATGLSSRTISRLRKVAIGAKKPGRPKFRLEEFPGVDWRAPIRQLMEDHGICYRSAKRLRAEALSEEEILSVDRPHKKKNYTPDDFPGTDWRMGSYKLSKTLGVSAPTARRLIKDALGDTAPPSKPGRRKYQVRDYPGVDWSKPNAEIEKSTGLSFAVIQRLRAEVMGPDFKVPDQRGRKKLRREDFPGVDWSQSQLVIRQKTGLSREVVCRLCAEINR